MTVEEIKQTYSMRDILDRYGIHVNRSSFASCPFHTGDRTPSLKVYKSVLPVELMGIFSRLSRRWIT